MVKIENTSTCEVVLQFRRGKSSYSKKINPLGAIKIADEQYELLVTPKSAVFNQLRISKYNIVGDLPSRYILHNTSNTKATVYFNRPDGTKYHKNIEPNTELVLSLREYRLCDGNIPDYVNVYNQNNKKSMFISDRIDVDEGDAENTFELRPEQLDVLHRKVAEPVNDRTQKASLPSEKVIERGYVKKLVQKVEEINNDRANSGPVDREEVGN